MVWGINYSQLPPEEFRPQGSYVKAGLVYTKLNIVDGQFKTAISLPNKTILNYWMVSRKDKKGNSIDIWDTGGAGKESFFVTFSDEVFFKPGYFIFLAGFLPLLLLYLFNQQRSDSIIDDKRYKVSEYIPELDSIRAIAVLLVIFHHWLPKDSLLNILPNGSLGVNIFFVISGYLITAILLRSKKQVESSVLDISTVFKNFYVRRTLRIFPIYYLVLIILLLAENPTVKEDGIYYFTYTANFLFYSKQFFSNLSHFWSLAVEEQFYLLWPWLIILVNRKLLPYLIALFLIIGISSNYIFTGSGYWVFVLTPACFDSFAIGAFLSYLVVYRQDIISKIRPLYSIILFFVLVIFILSLYNYTFLPIRTIHSLLAVTIIYYCLFVNNSLVANYVLKNKWLIRIGRISYGMYLYHFFTPVILLWIVKNLASVGLDLSFDAYIPSSLKSTVGFLKELLFLIFVCTVSWLLIEKPLNNLKKKFEYKPILKSTSYGIDTFVPTEIEPVKKV
ncbi:hypothetical protein GCM10023189_16600 [Nibrella saemangeumensis]|uniref:Acyltransferase 3 domain-containing protein n=2 Tax=Nibrella saemangeumensis TaxID=1084526 RepID=A0ABP8MQA9_9BACT